MTAAPQAVDKPLNLPVLLVVLSGMYALMATLSMTFPLLSLIMERGGAAESVIGLLGAMPSLGLLLVAGAVGPLNRRLGTYPYLVLSGLLGALMFGLLGAAQTLWVWFPALFVMGAAVSGIFVICEGWVNTLANEHNRGRVIGLYGTIGSLGLVTGPGILTLVGTRGAAPFVVGVACLLVFLVPITLLRREVPRFEGEHAGGVTGFLRLAPTLVLAVLVFGIFETTFATLFPVYATRAGLAEQEVTLAVAVLFVGYVLWQMPIGLLAERVNTRVLLVACAAVTALIAQTLDLVIDTPWLRWLMLFVWGGVGAGIYTLALVELGERFRGAALLAGNAAFALAWGVGGIAGPASTGMLIDAFGPPALPGVLTAMFGALALLGVYRALRG